MADFTIRYTAKGIPGGRRALQILPSQSEVICMGRTAVQKGDVIVYENPLQQTLGHYIVGAGHLAVGTYPVALIRNTEELVSITPQFFLPLDLWAYELTQQLVVLEEA